ncbi:hypothetical protein BD626DRAFT_572604 [Schizophyllum amplum]|uniref:Uncharacterized protein n=1 Tax=Schizophyllum amplum TaxID=97359 RepID=A0A550C4D1_9AGAR|nr:hypothetical protein BD626DRAFT_572604 [Auriculariopsis ampla]
MSHPQPRQGANELQVHSPPPSYHTAPSTLDLLHAEETTPPMPHPATRFRARADTPHYDEPECINSWTAFTDKGCTADASAFRNYEARLFGRLEGGAWRDMCRRTPAIVHGEKFPGAMRCADRGEEGIWGAWDLEDETCA